MSTFIFIPKTEITIDGEPELTDTLLSPLTYKSAELTKKAVTFSEGGFICAYGRGDDLLSGGVRSTLPVEFNAWVSDDDGVVDEEEDEPTDTATLDGLIVHCAPCERYEFPDLANSSWAPSELQEAATYHNNFSSTGQFIGRSITRTSRSASYEPLSFRAPIARIDELLRIKEAMRVTPIYVSTLAPLGGRYIMFGWAEGEPSIRYLEDYGQVELSFELRGAL